MADIVFKPRDLERPPSTTPLVHPLTRVIEALARRQARRDYQAIDATKRPVKS